MAFIGITAGSAILFADGMRKGISKQIHQTEEAFRQKEKGEQEENHMHFKAQPIKIKA